MIEVGNFFFIKLEIEDVEAPKRLLKDAPNKIKGFLLKNLLENELYLPSSNNSMLFKSKFKQVIGKLELVDNPNPTTSKFLCKNLTLNFVLIKAFSTRTFEVKMKQFLISDAKFFTLSKFQET
jgi:hypothetical protein